MSVEGESTPSFALHSHASRTQSCCKHWRVQGDLLSPMRLWETQWCDHLRMMHSFMLHTLSGARESLARGAITQQYSH